VAEPLLVQRTVSLMAMVAAGMVKGCGAPGDSDLRVELVVAGTVLPGAGTDAVLVVGPAVAFGDMALVVVVVGQIHAQAFDLQVAHVEELDVPARIVGQSLPGN